MRSPDFLPFCTTPNPANALYRPEQKKLEIYTQSLGGRLLIEGPRRIGKTTLVLQTVHPHHLLRVDLKGRLTESQVLNALRTAIETYTGRPLALHSKTTQKRQHSLTSIIGYLRDSSEEAENSLQLEDLFIQIEEFSKERRPLVVFIDEFQTLLEFPEGPALLDRIQAVTQHHQTITYIFAGSNSYLLKEIYATAKTPFYKQFEHLSLSAIPRPEFSEWIEAQLHTNQLSIDPSTLNLVFEFARDLPGDVQRVLAGAYSLYRELEGTTGKITTDLIEQAIETALRDKSQTYEILLRKLVQTSQKSQLSILLAIAANSHHPRPIEITRTGKSLRRLTGVDNSGTLSHAFNVLLKQNILSLWQRRYLIDDPFFEAYLIQQFRPEYLEIQQRISNAQK